MILKCIPRGNTNTKRYIHLNIHSSTIYISQDMEETQVSTTDDWFKKIWYTCTMEYYSAIKMNEILTFAAMRMDLENIVFSEMNQKDKSAESINYFSAESMKQ